MHPANDPSAVNEGPVRLMVNRPSTSTSVVRAMGGLDAHSAPVLTECVREQLVNGAKYVVIDLEAVEFLSSAGLGALLDSSHLVTSATPASKLYLAGTSERAVRKPLEMVGLLPLFNVYDTVDGALREIAAESAG